MLIFIQHYRTAWVDHFPGNYSNNFNSQTYSSRPTLSGTGVYFSNCLFRSVSSTSPGGALYCSNSVTYLLVESSSFFSCTSSSNGGALYVSCDNYVLYEVCGYDCYSTYTGTGGTAHGEFSYSSLSNVASNKNFINYSSIARCVTERTNTQYMICHHYGKHYCPSINVSMNKCYTRSGFYCWPTSDSNSIACLLSYSSFVDNNATRCICIELGLPGIKYEIKSCNILRNTQGTLNSEGTIYACGNTMIDDSCILENKATYIFRVSSSYTITLSGCTVDSTTYYGSLITKNAVTKSFILALGHMSTQNCDAEYDSVGYILTPITRSPSPSKKQKLCNTGERCFIHIQLRDVFSLTSILLFNFIHPYSSSYKTIS
jgi:hypothetical protein